jgi:hypothetical protein
MASLTMSSRHESRYRFSGTSASRMVERRSCRRLVVSKLDEKNHLVRCSFCAKDQEHVKKIVAGPNAFICDECVELSAHIIAEGDRG